MMVLFYQQPFLVALLNKSLSKAIIGKKFQRSRSPPLKAPQLSTIFKGMMMAVGVVMYFLFGMVR